MSNWVLKQSSALVSNGSSILFDANDSGAWAVNIKTKGASTTIYFSGNGANGYMPPKKYIAGSTIQLPACGYAMPGYFFKGWIVGGETDLRAEGSDYVIPSSNVMLIAQWNISSTTVTFKSDDTASAQTYELTGLTVGSTQRTPLFTITGLTEPTGKMFSYWAKDNASGARYEENAEYVVESDEVFVAVYADMYLISFDSRGGGGTQDSIYARPNVATALPTCTFTPPSGKQFLTWAIGSAEGTRVGATETTTFSGDTTVYARWQDVLTTEWKDNPRTDLADALDDGWVFNGDLGSVYDFSGTVNPSSTYNIPKTVSGSTVYKVFGARNSSPVQGWTKVGAKGATVLGDGAFGQCSSLTEVSFPAVTQIQSSVFYECANLSSAYFPEVTQVFPSAFTRCSALTSFDFSKVTSFGSNAFLHCVNLSSVSMTSNTFLNEYCFAYCSALPSTVTWDCKAMTKGVINGAGVRNLTLPYCSYIAGEAFCYASLVSITAPKLEVLNKSTFNAVWATARVLQTVSLATCSYIGSSVCTSQKNLTTFYAPSATFVGTSAFYECEALSNIDITAVQVIHSNAFTTCYNLSLAGTLNFPNLLWVGSSAFMDARVKSMNCPNLSYIYPNAFRFCSFSSFYAYSVYYIGAGAFYYGTSHIYLGTSYYVRLGSSNALQGIQKVYVPSTLYAWYKSTTSYYWSYYRTKIYSYTV